MRPFGLFSVILASIVTLASCDSSPSDKSDRSQKRDVDRDSAPKSAGSGPEKIRVISKGAAFKEDQYKLAGYVVILDFYADW